MPAGTQSLFLYFFRFSLSHSASASAAAARNVVCECSDRSAKCRCLRSSVAGRRYRFAFIIGFIEKNDREMKTTCDDPTDRDDSLRYSPAPRRQMRLRWQKLLAGPRPGRGPTEPLIDTTTGATNSIRFGRNATSRAVVVLAAASSRAVAWQRDDAIRTDSAVDGHYQFTVYRGWVHRNQVDSLSPAIQQFALLLLDLSLIWQAGINLKDCRGGTHSIRLQAAITNKAADINLKTMHVLTASLSTSVVHLMIYIMHNRKVRIMRCRC